ncbi:MAG: DUF624 domain-containing protein [Oscillospiraceae bacterium]|nr:DUF624 domain-containing protein [Oscillospiraceae bacterium]
MNDSFFNADNWLWKPFGRIADFLLLSGIWLLCSVPIVTAGAACTALYDCAAHCMVGGETGMFSRFFRTFRRELLLGTGSFALWAGILGGGFLLLRQFTGSAAGTDGNVMAAYAMAFGLALLFGVGAWVFPLLSRFTFGFGGLQATAVKMAFAFLPRTVLLVAVNIGAGWLCLRFLLPVMIVPGMAAYFSALILEPVFSKYEAGGSGDNNE